MGPRPLIAIFLAVIIVIVFLTFPATERREEVNEATRLAALKEVQSQLGESGQAAPASYGQFFDDVMSRTFGKEFGAILYDPSILNEVIKDPTRLVWRIPHPKGGPRLPAGEEKDELSTLGPLQSFEGQLLFAKVALGSYIGRLQRDADLAKLYESVRQKPLLVASMELSIRTLVSSMFRLVRLQITLSMFMSPTHRAELREMNAQLPGTPYDLDAVWFFFGALKPSMTVADAQRLFADKAAAWRTQRLQKPQLTSVAAHTYFDYVEWPHHNFIRQHQFMRNLFQCFDTARTCEDPEGCRFVCNGAYIMHANEQDFELMKSGKRARSDRGQPLWHRLLGGGSNNEYGWEESLLRFFGYGKPQRGGVSNGIYTMSIFDCTVNFNIPEVIKKTNFGFGYAQLCIGSKNDDKFLTYQEVKKRVLESEKDGYKAETPQHITRMAKTEGAVAPKLGGLLDDVTIFKLDVEGFEVDLLPDWALDDFGALNKNSKLRDSLAADPKSLISFTGADAPLSVSQFQVEIHAHANDFRNTQNWFHMRLLSAFLGFSQSTYEYNHFSMHGCCYEAVFPHYRFFIKSELWYAAGFKIDE